MNQPPSKNTGMKKRKVSAVLIIIGIVGVLVLAVVGIKVMQATAPQPKEVEVVAAVPSVRIHTVQKASIKLEVNTQGIVEPSSETTLVTEVTGKIMNVSPAMEPGAFFKAGDVLLEIDPRDYQSALATAIAEVARSEADMATEKAEADQAKLDWERMSNGKEASDLLLRLPQLARAEANLTSAKAAVDKATNDLERTRILAPYDGRSREQMAEIGQFAGAGTQLGRIFATDYAEVRLPLSDEQLGKLDPEIMKYRNGEWQDGPQVTLTGNVAGQKHSWQGTLIRLEGVVDEKSRFYYAIAKVNDPYGINSPQKAPLAVGMFVDAAIEGRVMEDVAEIPRNALHPGNKVYVVDRENRLEIRTVEVIHTSADTALIRSGLMSGDRVATTTLATPIQGMTIAISGEPNQPDPSDQTDAAMTEAADTTQEPNL